MEHGTGDGHREAAAGPDPGAAALAAAQRIGDPAARSQALADVVAALLGRGEVGRAGEVALTVPDPAVRERSLVEVVGARGRSGVRGSLDLAEQISDPAVRRAALLRLVDRLRDNERGSALEGLSYAMEPDAGDPDPEEPRYTPDPVVRDAAIVAYVDWLAFYDSDPWEATDQLERLDTEQQQKACEDLVEGLVSQSHTLEQAAEYVDVMPRDQEQWWLRIAEAGVWLDRVEDVVELLLQRVRDADAREECMVYLLGEADLDAMSMSTIAAAVNGMGLRAAGEWARRAVSERCSEFDAGGAIEVVAAVPAQERDGLLHSLVAVALDNGEVDDAQMLAMRIGAADIRDAALRELMACLVDEKTPTQDLLELAGAFERAEVRDGALLDAVRVLAGRGESTAAGLLAAQIGADGVRADADAALAAGRGSGGGGAGG